MTGLSTSRLRGLFIGVAIACAAGIGGTASAQSTPDYAAIIAASDRSDADRTADKRRDPLPFLVFAGLKPGMKVLDMGAGGGYSTELVARAVGPAGVVYGQNPPDQFERSRNAFAKRAEGPAMKSSVALLRPYDDPLPAEVRDLDMVTFLFFYHDVTYLAADRAQMNRKLFAALKPGGTLVIADHSAKPGSDVSVAKTLHRIDQGLLRKEVEAAGFKFVAEGNFWRNPADTFELTTQPASGPVDNFVLKFEKPR